MGLAVGHLLKELLRMALDHLFEEIRRRVIQRMVKVAICIFAAIVVIAVLPLPTTLSILVVYGLASGCEKYAEIYEKSRNEMKTSRNLQKEDHADAVEALSMI